jgi:NADPH-dependent curcumin reductase CurA
MHQITVAAKLQMPDQYRRLAITHFGLPFRDATSIVEEPVPVPGPRDVLIRNMYAGVNGIYDRAMCLGRIRGERPPGLMGTGVEAIGNVVAVGNQVSQFTQGDPVATVRTGFGYTQLHCCPEDQVIRIPEIHPEILALIPTGASAMIGIEQVGELTSGETVLVSAAAGGLGHIVLQLAVQADNHVIAITGSGEKCEIAASLGASRTINYKQESIADVLDKHYPEGINLIFDTVGGETFDTLVNHLAPRGRIVVSGHSSDAPVPAPVTAPRIYDKLYWRGASVRAFMNMLYPEFAADARARLMTLREAGKLRILVDKKRFVGLDQTADAVDHLLSGRNIGKVIVDLR